MRLSIVSGVAAGLLLLASPLLPSIRSSTRPLEPLAPLEAMIGTWAAGGHWENGDPFYTRNVFEWGAGKKVLKVQSYAGSPEKERLLFETFFFWHPTLEQIRMQSIAAFGHLYDGEVRVLEEGRIEMRYQGHSEEGVATHRQEYRFNGREAYDWQSFNVTEGGDELVVKTRFEKKP